jgi:hypothetical protein
MGCLVNLINKFMKKTFLISTLFLCFSFSLSAKNNLNKETKIINKLLSKVVRSKCDIIADDLKKFCLENGYSITDANTISGDVRKKCNELTPKKNT